MATDTEKRAKEIIERRDASKEYLTKSGLYDEWTEVERAYKCRTQKIYRENTESGKKEEDTSRTNVAMPDISIMVRRNTARLTANPPRVRYIGGSRPEIADALTALSLMQFDRSGEFAEHRRLVLQAELMGWAVSKLRWDDITVGRQYRYDPEKIRDRAVVMKRMGAPDDEIQQAVAELGPNLSDEEVEQVISSKGQYVSYQENQKLYEGPMVKALFSGDVFLEPGCRSLNTSGYVIEQYKETDSFLQKLAKMTWVDKETGKEYPVCNSKSVLDMLDSDSSISEADKFTDLRSRFLSTVGMEIPQTDRRLIPGKKFDIVECHEIGDDGRMWITWVGNDKYSIGKMPYEVDLCNKYAYTELVPLPDVLTPYGDSTPRLLRFLYYLHNVTVGQRTDYMTNLLKVTMLRRRGTDLGTEIRDRGLIRELIVSDTNGLTPLPVPPLPPGAWEQEGQIMRQLGIAEPSLNNVDMGSAANPMAGKTATTAVLASKAADALTQFKIDGVNLYLKELYEKKLLLNQYYGVQLGEAWQIGPKYQTETEEGGEPQPISLDPADIQEPYEVEPDVASILSVDDEINRQAAMELEQIAMAAPDLVDRREVLRFHLSKIRGIGNPSKFILPKQTGTQPPPFKGNINIALPFDKLPSDVQNQLLPMFGLQPSQELANRDTMSAVKELAAAGNAAADLHSPATPPEAEGVPAEVASRAGGVSSNG